LDNGLNLHVETQGDRLLLTWDRNNRVAKGAAKGVLHIDDGNLHRDVQLDGAQVANGAVLYKPNTDDVSFRLQVQGQHGSTVTENLRLLDGTGQSTQALDARRANAPQPTAPLTRSAPAAEISRPAVPPTAGPTRQPRNATRNPAPLSAPTEIPTLQPKPTPVQASERAALTTASEPRVSGRLVSAEKDLIQKQETPTPIQQEPEPEHVAQTTPVGQPALPVTTPQTEGSPAPTQNATAAVFAKNGVSPTPTESGVSPVSFAQRYVPPKPLSQVLPNLSELPRSLLNEASQVIVIVKVDRNGRVTEAQAQPSPDKVGRPITQAAETAARQWVFQPARLDGKPVASEHSIVFHFAR
jgi:hypothetical protein